MRRTIFPGWKLPVALVLPQLVADDRLLPAAKPAKPSGPASPRTDPFGLSSVFIGFENFSDLFSDPLYVDTIERTIGFVFAVCALSMGTALAARRPGRGRGAWPWLVSHHADLALCRGAGRGRGDLAVPAAPANRVARSLAEPLVRLGLFVERAAGDAAGGARERLETGELQLHFLRRRAAIRSQNSDGGGAHRWGGRVPPLPHHHLAPAAADDLLPDRGSTSSTPPSTRSAPSGP